MATNQYALERGWNKRRLIRELATKEKTVTVLAAEYGVTTGAISQFKTRHAHEITEVEADLDDKFAGLWIAKKEARLAAYEADAELLDAKASEADDKDVAALLRVKANALKSVAEEMGDLPTRMQVTVDPVTIRYEIAGVDPEDLT